MDNGSITSRMDEGDLIIMAAAPHNVFSSSNNNNNHSNTTTTSVSTSTTDNVHQQQQPSWNDLSGLLKRIEFLEKNYQDNNANQEKQQQHHEDDEETVGLLSKAAEGAIVDNNGSMNNNNNNNSLDELEQPLNVANDDDDLYGSDTRKTIIASNVSRNAPANNDKDLEESALPTINVGIEGATTSGGTSARNLTESQQTLTFLTSTLREENKVESRYDTYELPESTYTLLITEKKIWSVPFMTGIIATTLSIYCLVIALINELDNGTPDNPWGIAEVDKAVRQAQFLGIIIGVLMDEEVPMGLELIGKGVEQESSGGHKYSMGRIVFSSFLRLTVGYLFLFCLFLTIIQEETVLDIFFDVLALEFVENLDDVIFALCKRGFFGRRLRIATNRENVIVTDGKQKTRKFRRWTKKFVRFVYFANAIIMIVALIVIMQMQFQGAFRCESISVSFGDGVWESAWARLNEKACNTDSDCETLPGHTTKCHENVCFEQRLLIYSHFNGIYTENGLADERPRYIEMNKEDGDPFKKTTPAVIRYCESLEAWVLIHPDIKTSLDGNNDEFDGECDWLLRSPQTESFDLVKMAENRWRIWVGQIEENYRINVQCAECNTAADCNYHGKCKKKSGRDRVCECNKEYFGVNCQFERPCDIIRSEKESNTTLELLKDPNDDNVDFVEVYGRPMYKISNLQGKPYDLMRLGYPDDDDAYYGIEFSNTTEGGGWFVPPHKHYDPDFFADDDDFFQVNSESPEFQDLMTNYSMILRYTGRRWYGQIVNPGRITATKFDEEEWHAFWNNAFSGIGQEDNSTVIISAPTTEGSPVGVDFYEMRRRNKIFEGGIYDYDYSPYGVLIPLASYDGTGFFHCNKP